MSNYTIRINRTYTVTEKELKDRFTYFSENNFETATEEEKREVAIMASQKLFENEYEFLDASPDSFSYKIID